MKVLDELSEGKYSRTMVAAADSPDSKYQLATVADLWLFYCYKTGKSLCLMKWTV